VSAPTIQVLVGFQTTTGFGQPFQLDDAVYGLLNTGTLGGLAYADLTSLVESVNITRGRSRQLDQFNAGTATVTFNNSSRILDPLNTSSIYYPYVLPRCPIQILANGIPIYTGLITDWNLDYDIASNGDRMYAACSDAFTVLANTTLVAHTVTAETTNARINTVLNYTEVAYQGARNIGTGSSTLGASATSSSFNIADGTNLLTYLQLVNTSEQGYLFIAADGTLTFKGRSSVLNPVSGATFTYTGAGINYQTILSQYGDELLYNYIVTQSPAGVQQIASDATSIAQYQSQSLNLTNLLNSTVAEVAGLGNYLLGKYKNPVLRFTNVSTQMAALSTANQNICFNLDLTSIATVVKNFTSGTPATETQTLIVSGISHNITPSSHIISYTFESTDGNQYLTLGDTIFGTLSTTNLLSF
tara:strand:+ start:319 stop:1566 length:1248 start_codon:yes stop_codon:yes gene_type:complete